MLAGTYSGVEDQIKDILVRKKLEQFGPGKLQDNPRLLSQIQLLLQTFTTQYLHDQYFIERQVQL